jgi:hypothetical protein
MDKSKNKKSQKIKNPAIPASISLIIIYSPKWLTIASDNPQASY